MLPVSITRLMYPAIGRDSIGSELDLDPAPGVKVWCLGEVLGPAPGDPELLSACNADSRSARRGVEIGVTSQEAWVPVDYIRDCHETSVYLQLEQLDRIIRAIVS